MGPILTILAAVHEQNVASNAPNEELRHTAHDLHADPQSEAQNLGERENQGIVAGGPPGASPGHTSGGDHVGQDAHDSVQSGGLGGECMCPGNIAF